MTALVYSPELETGNQIDIIKQKQTTCRQSYLLKYCAKQSNHLTDSIQNGYKTAI